MIKRIIVCGGRDFTDRELLEGTLDAIMGRWGDMMLIHGAARGADRMASNWAFARGIPQWHFPADWKRYGKGAGPMRNQQMLDEGNPSLVVAFPGGDGTADMVRRAKAAGVAVYRIEAFP